MVFAFKKPSAPFFSPEAYIWLEFMALYPWFANPVKNKISLLFQDHPNSFLGFISNLGQQSLVSEVGSEVTPQTLPYTILDQCISICMSPLGSVDP